MWLAFPKFIRGVGNVLEVVVVLGSFSTRIIKINLN
jgi:hypothetical protein